MKGTSRGVPGSQQVHIREGAVLRQTWRALMLSRALHNTLHVVLVGKPYSTPFHSI